MEGTRPLRRNPQGERPAKSLCFTVGGVFQTSRQALMIRQKPMFHLPHLAGLDFTLYHQGERGHSSRGTIPQTFLCVCHVEALLQTQTRS